MGFDIPQKIIIIADIILFSKYVGRDDQQNAVISEAVHNVPQTRADMDSDVRVIEFHFLSVCAIIQNDGTAPVDAEQHLMKRFVSVFPPNHMFMVHQVINIIGSFHFEGDIPEFLGHGDCPVETIFNSRYLYPSRISDCYLVHGNIVLGIGVSFFRGVGIPAPVDESPLLSIAELYLRPGGNVNSRENRARRSYPDKKSLRRG